MNQTQAANKPHATEKSMSVEKSDSGQSWIGWIFFSDLFAGLRLTFKYMFAKHITLQYPDKEKWQPYSRFRGHHFLLKDEQGDIKCVACEQGCHFSLSVVGTGFSCPYHRCFGLP